eukprot:16439749-Heterocapsa_arctica.AAC.1
MPCIVLVSSSPIPAMLELSLCDRAQDLPRPEPQRLHPLAVRRQEVVDGLDALAHDLAEPDVQGLLGCTHETFGNNSLVGLRPSGVDQASQQPRVAHVPLLEPEEDPARGHTNSSAKHEQGLWLVDRPLLEV